MSITTKAELIAAAVDFVNRDDIGGAMDTLTAVAEERILTDRRSRGTMTEFVQESVLRDPAELVNPLPLFTNSVTENTGEPTFNPTDSDTNRRGADFEIKELFVNDEEYMRLTWGSYQNADSNDKVYCFVGGKLFVKGFDYTDGASGETRLKAYGYRKDRMGTRYRTDDNPLLGEVDDPTVDSDDLTFIDDEGNEVVDPFAPTAPAVVNETVTTSNLLIQQPNVFLYALLTEIAIYLRDIEGVQIYQSRYDELMNLMHNEYKRGQVAGGWQVGSVGGDNYFDRSY